MLVAAFSALLILFSPIRSNAFVLDPMQDVLLHANGTLVEYGRIYDALVLMQPDEANASGEFRKIGSEYAVSWSLPRHAGGTGSFRFEKPRFDPSGIVLTVSYSIDSVSGKEAVKREISLPGIGHRTDFVRVGTGGWLGGDGSQSLPLTDSEIEFLAMWGIAQY